MTHDAADESAMVQLADAISAWRERAHGRQQDMVAELAALLDELTVLDDAATSAAIHQAYFALQFLQMMDGMAHLRFGK